MQKEINLLPHRNLGILQQERTIMLVRIIAIFSVVIIISSGIGLFFLGKTYSLDNMASQQQNIQSRLNLLSGKATKELQLVDRMKRIEKIFGDRSSLLNQINTVQQQVPQGVDIDTLTVTKEDVSMSVSSNSLTQLRTLLNSLTQMVSEKKVFKKLTIQNVVLDQKTGIYSVGVEGTFL